jgi:glycosyltransferase involved in cell wall biosynthesis
MILKNYECYTDYDIPEDWFKNRLTGISAMIRSKNNEKTIDFCLWSLLKKDIFDEIIITDDSTDGTKDIIKEYQKKYDIIKLFDYPFALEPQHGRCFPDSLHDQAYYTNWSMSKTRYKVICKWDTDMVLSTNEKQAIDLWHLAMHKNIVRIKGYDVTSLNPIKLLGIDHYEPRLFKISPYLYFVQATKQERATQFKEERCKTLPLCKLERFTYDRAHLYDPTTPLWKMRFKNWVTRNDIYYANPAYYHFKYCKKPDLAHQFGRITKSKRSEINNLEDKSWGGH